MNDYFDMMIKTYEKYYSMINSLALSFKTIKNISNMNNILDINLFPNDILPENLNSFNSLISDKLNEIKNIFPIKIEINFREGLIQTGNCSTFTTEHKEFMTGGIFVNNGKYLVTSATDKSLIIYQPELVNNEINYIVIKKEIENKIIATTLLNLVKEYFVVGYDDGLIKVWRTEDCEVDKIFTGHTAQINKIIKETDNSFISCSDDMTIRGWTLDTLEADSIYILTGHEDKINDIIIISDNTTLLSVSDDKTLRIWSLELKECINAIKLDEIQTCLSYLNNGRFMTGGEDGSVTIYNIEGFEPSLIFNAHNEPIEVL
jgi:WD40 repeat protein